MEIVAKVHCMFLAPRTWMETSSLASYFRVAKILHYDNNRASKADSHSPNLYQVKSVYNNHVAS